MSFKRVLSTYTLHLGFVLFVIGIVLTILGIIGVFYYDQSPDSLKGVIDTIGNWRYWCILLGPILIIAGGWYFFDNVRKRREFLELIETTSKAKFIRNLDRVEYLAWKLTLKHQEQFMDKKKEFHIK